LALLVIWYARSIRFLFFPALVLNAGVILSTPVQGGHHLIDVIAAFPIAALAIFVSARRRTSQAPWKASIMVNKSRKFTITPVPTGFFRITAEQKRENTAPAIKSKLSGAS
jgi:membrane-associated phospholipid phosphatase